MNDGERRGYKVRPNFISENDFVKMQNAVKRSVDGRPDGRKPLRATDPLGARPSTVEGRRQTASPYKGYRSKLELNWANYLDVLKAVKDIDGWAYEPLRFKLPGERNYYKIDFSAWKNGRITFFEIKGWNQSDSRSLVKLKTAAGLNPWANFVLVKNHDGLWDEQVIRV